MAPAVAPAACARLRAHARACHGLTSDASCGTRGSWDAGAVHGDGTEKSADKGFVQSKRGANGVNRVREEGRERQHRQGPAGFVNAASQEQVRRPVDVQVQFFFLLLAGVGGASACRALICLHSVRLDGCELGCGCPSLADLAILSNEQKSAKGDFPGPCPVVWFPEDSSSDADQVDVHCLWHTRVRGRTRGAALSPPLRLAKQIGAAAAAGASAVVLRSTFLDLGVNHPSRAPLSLTPTFACTLRATHVAISHPNILTRIVLC